MPYHVLGYTQGTGAISAHRYWRVLITAMQVGNPRAIFPEIEMRESVGGADVTSTSFATASTTAPSSLAEGAFNNSGHSINSNNYWEPNAGPVGQWIGQDFGAGNEKEIVEMKFWQNASYALPQVDIQYSDDGSLWTTVHSVTYTPSWPATENIISW